MAQVGGPNKENIDTVHSSDGGCVLQAFSGLDLRYPSQRFADCVDIGVFRGSVAGTPRAQTNPSNTERRVAEKP